MYDIQKYANLKTDLGFLRVLGNENFPAAMISLLNAVLAPEAGQEITSLQSMRSIHLKAPDGKEGMTLDLLAVDQTGAQYIIEVQGAELPHLNKRAQYLVSKYYSGQIERIFQQENLHPTKYIGFLNFNFTESAHFLSRHKFVNVETLVSFFPDIEWVFVELPKFDKKESELTSLLDQWLYFIKNAETLKRPPSGIEDAGLKAAWIEAEQHL